MVPLSFPLSLALSDAILLDSRIPVSERVLPEISDEEDDVADVLFSSTEADFI